jgi:protein-tyrosine phosphatase
MASLDGSDQHDPAAFRVLFVCTANLCRSPIAERLFRQRLSDGSGPAWSVASAGTHGFDGHPMHPSAAQVVRERGGAPEDFRSRPLTAEIVRSADLVLTAGREHRSVVVQLVPAAVRRSFTIRQFARLCAAVPPLPGDDPRGVGPALVAEALLARSEVPPAPPSEDDLADPIGQPVDAFRLCADSLEQALGAVVRPLPS